MQNGAYGTACCSDKRAFVHRIGTAERAEDLIRLFPEADVIFLEGWKDRPWPKIEVVRREISSQPVSDPEGRFLIATDWPEDRFPEKTADLNDIDGILSEIRVRIGSGAETPESGAAPDRGALSACYGCVLLAGGKGLRMGGVNKAALMLEGKSFAERIAGELWKTGLPCMLSRGTCRQEVMPSWRRVSDAVTAPGGQGAGPLGGIVSCLREAGREGLRGLFFVPCDAPLFDVRVITRMLEQLDDAAEAAVWRTRDGRIQCTFGYYSVSYLPQLEKEVRSGHLKLGRVLSQLRVQILSAEEAGLSEDFFRNVNTAEDAGHLTGTEG